MVSILLVGTTLFLGSCGPDRVVKPWKVVTVPKGFLQSPIHDLGIIYLNGLYQNCKDRKDQSHFSARVGAFAEKLPYEELTVVWNDANCHLLLSEVVMTDAKGEVRKTFRMKEPLPLPNAYLVPPVAPVYFYEGPNAVGAPDFYANFRLVSEGFGDDFLIEFVYSDKPQEVGALNQVGYAVAVAYPVRASAIPAPDYGTTKPADFVTGNFKISVDADLRIETASGYVRLQATDREAEKYMIVSRILKDGTTGTSGNLGSFADVEYTYNLNREEREAGIYSGYPVDIWASYFRLPIGEALDTFGILRYVIFKHQDPETRGYSYEVVSILFMPPGP